MERESEVELRIKIPEGFKIGATEAHIFIKKDQAVDDGYNGSYNRRTEELFIDDRLVGKKRNRTFGHELMEVIKENYELKLEEDELSCIANGWLEFLYQLGIQFDWSDIKEK